MSRPRRLDPALVWLLVVATATGLGVGCHDDHGGHAAAGHDGHAPPPAAATDAAPANPVQAEMRLLATALETAVRGIGSGDVREVEHALHRVHAATETTRSALTEGSYRPPKNGDRLGRFRELDEAFHGRLEPLADAARANDVARTAEAVGAALGACHGCHTEFKR